MHRVQNVCLHVRMRGAHSASPNGFAHSAHVSCVYCGAGARCAAGGASDDDVRFMIKLGILNMARRGSLERLELMNVFVTVARRRRPAGAAGPP
jgi:hypothetical protein